MHVLYEKLLITDDYMNTSVKGYLDNLIEDIIKLFPETLNLNNNLTKILQMFYTDLTEKILKDIGCC